MIIVLSPAKTLDYESPLNGFDYTTPNFLGKSESLIKIMRSYEPEYISELMGLSDNLAFMGNYYFIRLYYFTNYFGI